MASLADMLRAKYGNMVWDTPQSPGALYPGMNMQPQTQGLDFTPSQEQPNGYAMMFDAQPQQSGFLSMIGGRPEGPAAGMPQGGLLSMIAGRPDMLGSNTPDRYTAPQPMQRPVTPDTYLVRKGDTLTAIAKRYGTTVKALMAKNPQIKNANKIVAGKTKIKL